MEHRFHFWYVAFSAFFAFLLFTGFWWLNLPNSTWSEIPTRDIILLTLATFRLIRLFTYDKITGFFRDWLMTRKKDTCLQTIGELMTCPWCTGFWFAAIVVFVYFAMPYLWPGLLILAIAGVASVIQLFANLVGWYAEGEKGIVEQSK